MFIQNKYLNWYNNIIRSAVNRENGDVYYERHHIIPKSLGGSNHSSNLVKVTAREHYILHLLLVRFTTGDDRRKMIHAAWYLCHKNKLYKNHKVSSRIYESLRIQHATACSQILKGQQKSLETRERMRQAALNRTTEHRMRKSLAQIGRVYSEETKRKLSEKAKNRTPEQRANYSKGVMGIRWWTNGEINLRSRISPGDGWRIGRKL